MTSRFKDHFSGLAGDYARYRPRYPDALYDFICERVERRRLAWDCGTGNGQSAVPLARRFDRVIATDPSESQIAHAIPGAHIDYRVAPDDGTDIETGSVDLVTVAQALHWFHFDRFYEEVRRVAGPDAWLAVWCYDLFEVEPAVDDLLRVFYEETTGPHWPPERRYIRSKYETVPFPFETVEVPAFTMTAVWSVDEMLGYLGTWSAVHRHRLATGENLIDHLSPELRRLWAGRRLDVRWPIHLKLGRVRPRLEPTDRPA